MTKIIYGVVNDPFADRVMFGLVVSDDDFIVLSPEGDDDEDNLDWVVNDYNHRFAEIPQDADARWSSAMYNTLYMITDRVDVDSDDFDGAVEALRQTLRKGS